MATVASVNVGAVRSVTAARRTVATAIWKAPVEGRVAARGVNLDGDDQADRAVHGGPDKAVYAYGAADYTWWKHELGRPLEPGTFGENLTIAGMAVSDAVVGERWEIGTATFEVSQPRTPCGKLGIRMGDPRFPRRFAHAGRPGAYLRIIVEGDVGRGDEVTVVHRPGHGLTVSDVARASEGELSVLPDLLIVPELAEVWVEWAFGNAVEEMRSPGADVDHDRLRAAVLARLILFGVDPAEAESVLVGLVEGTFSQ